MRGVVNEAGNRERKEAGGTAGAWFAFERNLAELLAALEEDQYLVVSSKRGWAYVQWAAQGSYGLRAETVSNNYLPSEKRLTRRQVADLGALGWRRPSIDPRKANPKRDPDGSPNFFRDFERPVPFGDVARLAVRTLREVHAVAHPGSLDYAAFDRERRDILLPTLGLKRRRPAPPAEKAPVETPGEVRARVLETLREASGDPDLEVDGDGDVTIRVGDSLVFASVLEDPLCVRVSSPIVVELEEEELPLEHLNELNGRLRYARLFVREGAILAAVEVPASPYVAQHVVDAYLLVGGLAVDLDETLRSRFGGRTPFGERRSKASVQ